ncbi:DUF418 domain-containing protein [Sphingomonas antarctica]
MKGRLETVDAIRGFAVCGILIMNIVSMGEPGYAYIDPSYYGGATGGNLAAWALAYVFADGKMRMLFTMLFGASLAITTDRAEHPARVHYSRMVWLLAFGMIHGWLFWYGDILVEYACIGAILFVARKWPVSALIYAGLLLIVVGAGMELANGAAAEKLREAASMPGASAAARQAWTEMLVQLAPPKSVIAFELEHYRGGFWSAFEARKPMITMFQTLFLPVNLPGGVGIAALGLAAYRSGFLGGAWRRRRYVWVASAGAVALLAYVPIVRWLIASHFDPVLMTLTNNLSLLLRLFVAFGYAAALILLVQSGAMRWLVTRLAAAGRMAFSNYLGTTLITTTLFYGYGFGLFGTLERAQLYWIVLGVWTLILLWSKPWLARFHYGPLEWLWRSLARGERQPFLRRAGQLGPREQFPGA